MWIHFLIADARYATRALIRCPRFTVPSVLMIAAGIALSSVVFAVFDAEVLRVLPYPEADRLVAISSGPQHSQDLLLPLAPSQVSYLQHSAKALQDVACYKLTAASVAVNGDASRVPAAVVSPNFFTVLGANPQMGQGFGPDVTRNDSAPTVVISGSLGRRAFGANTTAIGRYLNVDRIPRVVVGVMPDGFRFPMAPVDLWIPEPLAETSGGDIVVDRFAFGRLARGHELAAANAELGVLARQREAQYPGQDMADDQRFRATLLKDTIIGPTGKILAIILIAVLILQVMASINVSSLLLARSRDRLQEIGVRLAMGASFTRLFQLVLLESVLLAFIGCALGLAGAAWGVGAVNPLTHALLRSAARPTINTDVMVFSLAVAVVSSLFFGIRPALGSLRVDIRSNLTGPAQSRTGRLWDMGSRSRRVLPALQIALAALLLVAFGLVLRTLFRLTNVELGFDPHGVIAVQMNPSWLPSAQAIDALHEVLEAVGRWPEVQSAAIGTTAPFSGLTMQTRFSGEASSPGWGRPSTALMQHVSGGYFRTLRIPILRGRSFNLQDRTKAPCVAIVNQALARMLWPAEEAVGRRLDLNSDPSAPYMCEVVGAVGDARDRALDAAPSPTVYFSCLQPTLGTGMAVILIRSRGDRQPPAERIRAAVKAADPSREILSMNSVSSGIDAVAKPADVRAKMLGAFAVLALLLGCVGLYATETYSVSQQMHEVGIRMALGATGNDVIAAILRRSALTAASGLAIGLGLALVVTRLTSGLLLFNVSPGDPLTYLSVAALLLLVALAAATIPARRAASVDPAVLLRSL